LRRLIVEEPVARAAQWSRRLAIFALAIAVVAIALSRIHAADPPAALAVFAAALVIAALAAMLAGAAAVVIWRDGLRGAGQAAFGFALAAALIAYPVYLAAASFVLPPINDVSTDIASPPTFLLSMKARAARAGAEPPPSSEETRKAQREAYPDLETIEVEMDPTEAYRVALSAASDLGWRIVDAEPPNLRRRLSAHRGGGPFAVLRIRERHRHPHPAGGDADGDRRPLRFARRKARFRRQRAARPPIRRRREGGGPRGLRRRVRRPHPRFFK